MDDEDRELLKSLKLQSKLQTAAQIAAAAELEAHRRELAAQTELMAAAELRKEAEASERQQERAAMAAWREALTQKPAISREKDLRAKLEIFAEIVPQLIDPPEDASLIERTTAKELLALRGSSLDEFCEGQPGLEDWAIEWYDTHSPKYETLGELVESLGGRISKLAGAAKEPDFLSSWPTERLFLREKIESIEKIVYDWRLDLESLSAEQNLYLRCNTPEWISHFSDSGVVATVFLRDLVDMVQRANLAHQEMLQQKEQDAAMQRGCGVIILMALIAGIVYAVFNSLK